MKFAIIDVETTGLNPSGERITELGLVIIEDGLVTLEQSWLFNPEKSIPKKITLLTGISDGLVAEAPLFADHAEEIMELTEGCIFTGHHVAFDYYFVRQEMRRSGFTFTRKTLCTAALSRYFLNDQGSFSLASLCKRFGVVNSNPHRALPDTKATAEILNKLAELNGWPEIEKFFSGVSLIPDHLKTLVKKELPAQPGVYYFMAKNGKPVYIGKAAKIKGRVASHFRDTYKVMALGNKVNTIKYKLTGDELMASLLEDHEIRHYWPPLNSAQKNPAYRFGVVCFMNHRNEWRMAIARSGKLHCFIAVFAQYHNAVSYVNHLVSKFKLNSELCGLPTANQITVNLHNRNFDKMMANWKQEKQVDVYFRSGRAAGEKGFILVENNQYKGLGYLPEDAILKSADDIIPFLLPMRASITAESIVRQLQSKNQPSLTLHY